MADDAYVITPIWGRTWVGASETYITPAYSPAQAKTKIPQFLQLRADLMHTDSYWQGARLSVYGGNRKSSVLVPPNDYFPAIGDTIIIPSAGTYNGSSGPAKPTLMRNSLQLAMTFDNGRVANRYLADVPVGIVGGEPVTYLQNGNPGWVANLLTYQQFLVNNAWRVRAIDKSGANPQRKVIGVTVQSAPPGLIGVIIRTTGAPGIQEGDKIQAQQFRPAKGTRAPTLNGTWIVESVDVTQAATRTIVYLRSSQNIDPTAQRITDKTFLRSLDYALYPITNVGTKRVVPHKRGRPSSAPRGRRLTRPSLDP